MLLVLNTDRVSLPPTIRWRPSGRVENKLTSLFAISDLPIGVEAFKPVAFYFRQIIMTHIDRVHFVIV